ncbi:uncharacterized protein LOC118198066 [Stegodyphus dumicola]|uniref:uncharacterized protein LOC118198066 n=1 Tax=Stegodyphus dumicola TaxID=202533 RepID=UPI0015B2FAF6|nr:uncharacterized protein LOC118198066 [Stegodyphus dumicola]
MGKLTRKKNRKSRRTPYERVRDIPLTRTEIVLHRMFTQNADNINSVQNSEMSNAMLKDLTRRPDRIITRQMLASLNIKTPSAMDSYSEGEEDKEDASGLSNAKRKKVVNSSGPRKSENDYGKRLQRKERQKYKDRPKTACVDHVEDASITGWMNKAVRSFSSFIAGFMP